jgi:dipeptidyl aminopeptidase/acylaminoacyl peptidase
MDRICGSHVRASAVAALVLLSFSSVAAAAIPIEHFAADPVFAQPAMSPDGSRLVYLRWIEGKPLVIMLDLETKEARALVSGRSDTFTINRCDFKTKDRIVCGFRGVDHDAGRPFWTSRLVALDADGKNIRTLIQNGAAGAAQFQDRILHWLPDDPHRVLIEVDDDRNVYPSVFSLDVFTGRMSRVLRDRTPVTGWMTDRTGTVRFGFGYAAESTAAQYVARSSVDAPWRVLEKFKRFESRPFTPLGFGARPNVLLVSATHNGRDAIWEMDLDESNDFQLLFANHEVDVDDAILWPADGHVVGFQYETDRPYSYYIDPAAASVAETLNKLLPDTSNHLVGGSRDGKKLLVHAYSDVKPSRYYVLDLGKGKLIAVGVKQPALDTAVLAPQKPIRIKTAEGLSIPGYLTLPVGKDPKNLPTIVYPHGGPYARDHWGFDEVVQMMASRGYAVLQVNFRGSTGFGDDWLDAGWQAWGTVMHDDITAGARWLIGEGIADPKRMCIVGWSYGGYAALIGVVKEPDLYRCAVSIAGVSDLPRLQRDDGRFYGGRAARRALTGSNRSELLEVSPLKQANRIKVPVLLVHGEDDIQVLVDHSKVMARELNRNDIRNELVLIKEGDHALSRGEWRLTLFTRLEKFLAENLGSN